MGLRSELYQLHSWFLRELKILTLFTRFFLFKLYTVLIIVDDLNDDLKFITMIYQQFLPPFSYFGRFELENFNEYFYWPNRCRCPKNHCLCGFGFVKVYFSLTSMVQKYWLNLFYSLLILPVFWSQQQISHPPISR